MGTTILSPSGGCVQVNPGSMVQVGEHPSPATLLPSSHASATTMPSPHFDTHDAPEHPGSLRQSSEQPSNGRALPSSQVSVPSTTPSPHFVGVQALGLPLHFQPISTLQVVEQPSPAVAFPSSQSSGVTCTPSPQRATRWLDCPGGWHEKPGSTIRQSAAHPSPDTLLPSSHASSRVRWPFPHPGGIPPSRRTPGVVGPPPVPPPMPPPVPPPVPPPSVPSAARFTDAHPPVIATTALTPNRTRPGRR